MFNYDIIFFKNSLLMSPLSYLLASYSDIVSKYFITWYFNVFFFCFIYNIFERKMLELATWSIKSLFSILISHTNIVINKYFLDFFHINAYFFHINAYFFHINAYFFPFFKINAYFDKINIYFKLKSTYFCI